ncbi:protein kinase-like protein [Leptomonas seymouri]|uniref:Protein kinase-like protein n=1 Tax=Leptomonas seymouri TaxID=5684 RepID=A0A0N1I6G8_LEPSE|nr:protein kinase-like protein [Leptomonas seymouri]|eukprot:KPI86530.1 protein kinase-like protein [Leptomonas seymouri]
MPVSSLLERMRKKLQEKAAAAGGAESKVAATDPMANSSINTGGEQGLADANASQNAGGGGSSSNHHHAVAPTSTSHRAELTVPLPPPVFASPSSARLDYRDTVNDPLCVPFTADMAAPIVAQLLQASSLGTIDQAGTTSSVEPTSPETPSKALGDSKEEGTTSVSTQHTAVRRDLRSTQNSTAAIDKAVRHLRELLSVMNRDTTGDEQLPHSGAVEGATAHGHVMARASSNSLLTDTAYINACALSRVDVSGAERQMCRDVAHYTRVGCISQGVYGVVFRAVAASDEGVTAQPHRLDSVGEVGSAVPTTCPTSTPSSPQRKSYALKHIKKMWLENSQVGFPPYLLREIDLLLRLRHPNVMGARELVLLDPTPLPRPLQTLGASAGPSLEAARLRHRPRAAENGAMKEDSLDDASPPHQRPKRYSLASATSSNHSDAVTATAADRPLAAVGAVSETKDVFLVMDFCPFDLTTYMRRYHTTPTCQIPYFHITSRNAHPDASANYVARAKSIAYQLFNAATFMHANRILHRDLKASNVLLDDNGYVKVCDFGLGRLYREGQGLTPTVVTLMYRAPELHLGVADYSHKMDVWSLGCILAELFLRRPLFHASTDSHHLLAVCDVIGIPTEETFPGLYHLPQTKVMMQSLPRWNRVSRLADLFKPGATMFTPAHGDVPVAVEATLLPAEGLELLQQILQWNPRRRPSAEEALRHPFFHTEPLPCAPEELMRPIPWKDAVPPSTARRSPPPATVVQAPAVASTGTSSAPKGAAPAGEGEVKEGVPPLDHPGNAEDGTRAADIASHKAVWSARADGAEKQITTVSLAATRAAPVATDSDDVELAGDAAESFAAAKLTGLGSYGGLLDGADSPGRGVGLLRRHMLDEEGDVEAEREVRLAQMKSNQDLDDAEDAQ